MRGASRAVASTSHRTHFTFATTCDHNLRPMEPTDLPDAVWAQVLAHTTSSDLLALARTCRGLRHLATDVRRGCCWCRLCRRRLRLRLHWLPEPAVVVAPRSTSVFLCLGTPIGLQDALWRQQCEAWLATARSPSNGLAALSSLGLRDALRLPSYRSLFQVLHALGSWPAGLWYATNESAGPRGRLLVVQLHLPSSSLRLQAPQHRVLTGPVPAEDAWELRPGWAVAFDASAEATKVSC